MGFPISELSPFKGNQKMSSHLQPWSVMPSTKLSREITLLATTSLKWTLDGELCAEDRLVLFHRLRQIDPRLGEWG
jgi:hypothetical protein